MRSGRHRRPEGIVPEPSSQPLVDEEHKTKSKLSTSPLIAGLLTVAILVATLLSLSSTPTEPASAAAVANTGGRSAAASVPEATSSHPDSPLQIVPPASVTTTIEAAAVHTKARPNTHVVVKSEVVQPAVLHKARLRVAPFPRPIFDNRTCPSTTVWPS